MKPILVFYATREGHTCRIAERVADRIHARGLAVQIRSVGNDKARIDLDQCSAVILAASVHQGKHEPEMVGFVKRHFRQLQSLPSAFLSASLSQAGAERIDATPEEHTRFKSDVQNMLNAFFQETHWHPDRVVPVAGALMYRKYNWVVRRIMKRIAKASGGSTDTTRNHDYTNWSALDRFAEEFMQRLPLDRERAHSS
jgi:menaquinone-dependent protoporphyrinogen oxidase